MKIEDLIYHLTNGLVSQKHHFFAQIITQRCWEIRQQLFAHTSEKPVLLGVQFDSKFFLFTGLLLGCCLLILVCTISEEFGPANSRTKLSSSSSVLKSESRSYLQRQNPPISSGQTKDEYTSGDQYSYGWSFILATLGFLGSELSALLCLAAFLNRFDSEVKILKAAKNISFWGILWCNTDTALYGVNLSNGKLCKE